MTGGVSVITIADMDKTQIRTEYIGSSVLDRASGYQAVINGKKYKVNDNICEILSNHITNPVRFTNCLKEMYKNGIDTFIEIGPGKTLSGFVKRMKFEKPINILNINSVKTLENVLTELSRKEND